MTQTDKPQFNDKLLTGYLQGHIAAADSGAQVFEEARKLWEETPYGERIQALSADVEQDRRELRNLANQLGAELSVVKSAISFIGRKLSHLSPLNPTGDREGLPGQFELEALYSAVSGKECLWQTLQTLSREDARLEATQLQRLKERAVDQKSRITGLIQDTAAARFRSNDGSSPEF